MNSVKVDRIVKFEAAAGSGKTHQLTLEYLKRIFKLFNDHIGAGGIENLERLLSSILAITFTNKAANEMKERILGKLKRFSLISNGAPLSGSDKEVLEELSQHLHLSEKDISELATFIIETIISHYNDFNVKTIDSLMSSIIKVISPDLNLPPDFEIGVDASDMAREKAKLFIENICHKDWKFLEDVLENIKNSESLHRWNIDEIILDHIIKFYEMALSRGDVENITTHGVVENVFKIYKTFKENLIELLSVIQEDSDDGVSSAYVNKHKVNRFFIRAIQDFIDSDTNLQKINPVINKAFFRTTDPSLLLKKDVLDEYRKKFTQALKKTRDQLSEFLLWLSLNRLNHFSQFLSGFVRFWEEERKKIFVSEFSKTIKEKLSAWEKSSLPYIYLKLSDRFRHFLFDEFQDTSELQFKALTPILEEVLISDEKSSLFIVGDRKQAIYRWRGGNADLMNEERLKQELKILSMIAQEEKISRPLSENWRSQSKIVEFNNWFWNPEHLRLILKNIGASDDLIGTVQENFESVEQKIPPDKNPDKGYVNIQINSPVKTEETYGLEKRKKLDQKCLEIIEMLENKGYRGSDIAILTRTNAEGRDIVRFLSEHKVPTLSDESLFLMSSRIINEIISFFRFINYPPDNLNFYTFICGKIFQKEAQKQFPEEMKKFDESFFIGTAKSAVLYKMYKDRFPRSWGAFIEPFVKQAGFYPPYDIFQDMTQIFQLYENFADSAMFLLSFGSILHELEQEEINSISSFLVEWEKSISSKNPYAIDMSEDETRVRVLTIHKAKGLEFPVVIVPILDKRISGENNLFWEDGDFFHITKDFARINPRLKKMYLREINREFIDELNLLYVAFTRAKDALFIPLVHRPPSKPPTSDDFKRFKDFSELVANCTLVRERLQSEPENKFPETWMDVSFGEFPEKKAISIAKDKGADLLPVYSKTLSTSAWQKDFLVFKPSDFYTEEEQKVMDRGESIHRVLSRIEFIKNRDETINIVKPLAETENLSEDDIALLEKFLKNESVFRFFQGDMVVHNEIEVAGTVNNQIEHRRIDRLIIKGDEVFIIDYKTGNLKKDEYVNQIEEYKKILNPLFPGKQISGYLLFVDAGLVEKV